jgi:hypothetical protein
MLGEERDKFKGLAKPRQGGRKVGTTWSGLVQGSACEVCRTEIRASRGKWKGVANREWAE